LGSVIRIRRIFDDCGRKRIPFPPPARRPAQIHPGKPVSCARIVRGAHAANDAGAECRLWIKAQFNTSLQQIFRNKMSQR
jgi:hypothetical protein